MDKRLEAALPFLNGHKALYDVGTDHAYFPIEAIKQGRIKQALAIDNKRGPLLAARNHIEKAGLDAQIKTLQADGLAALTPSIDVVMIAGMGGATITDILLSHDHLNVKRLILQPNNNTAAIRRYVNTAPYRIGDEVIVKQKNEYYFILVLDRASENTSPSDPFISFSLLNKKDTLYHEYVQKRYRHLNGLLEKIPDTTQKPVFSEELASLRRILDEWH